MRRASVYLLKICSIIVFLVIEIAQKMSDQREVGSLIFVCILTRATLIQMLLSLFEDIFAFEEERDRRYAVFGLI